MNVASRTVLDAVRGSCDAFSDLPAFTFWDPSREDCESKQSISYGELDEKAKRLAVRLRDTSEGPVILLMQPGIDYYVTFFAAIYAGMPAVPVYPPSRVKLKRDIARLSAILAKIPDAILVAEPGILNPLKEFIEDHLPQLRPQQLIDTTVPDNGIEGWRSPKVALTDPLFIQFTSGSTTDPRGAVISHENLLDNVGAITERFGLDTSSRGALWLPPYHDMGLIGGVLTPIITGFPIHLMSPHSFLADPMSWPRLLSETRATHTGAPNFGYALAARHAREEDVASFDLTELEVAFSGAEPVDAETLRHFADRFALAGFDPKVFLPCYGLAEATLIVSGSRPQRGARVLRVDSEKLAFGRAELAHDDTGTELVSCGSVVSGTGVMIVDPTTRKDVGENVLGEIIVASPSVAKGYLNDPAKSRSTFDFTVPGSLKSWMRTGDLGFLSDGELVPVTRIKDLILVRGRNIYPQDVENTVYESDPRVRRGCVAAASLPGTDGSDEILIVAELRPEAVNEDTAGIKKLARSIQVAVTASHSVPVHTVHLIRPGGLPKTSSGKVQRDAARQAHLEGRFKTLACVDRYARGSSARNEAHDPSSPEDLATRVADAIIAHYGGDDGTTASLDSLAATRLTMETSQLFRMSLPLVEIMGGIDADRLATLIRTDSGKLPQLEASKGKEPRELLASAKQEALCFLQELDPHTPGLVLGVGFRLASGVLPEDLARGLNVLVSRHPALRTRFVRRGCHWQRIIDAAEQHGSRPWGRYCSILRLDEFPVRPIVEELEVRTRRVPDLATGPLFHAEFISATGQPDYVVITIHHAIADLWAIGILAKELSAVLETDGVEARSSGSYTDVSATLQIMGDHDERMQSAWSFWDEVLADTGNLRLPTANSSDSKMQLGIARHSVHAPVVLDTYRAAALRRLATECGTTLYAVLVAAQALALREFTDGDRVPVAVTLHGRDADSQKLVDYIASTVVLPVDVVNGTVHDLVVRSSELLSGVFEYADIGYPELVSKSASIGGPSVPVPEAAVLLQQDTPGAPSGLGAGLLNGKVCFGGHNLSVVASPPSIGPFGLVTLLTSDGDELIGRVEVDPAHYSPSLAQRFAALFLQSVDLLTSGDQQLLVELTNAESEWMTSEIEGDGDGLLHELVLDAAGKYPERTALVAGSQTLTYAELDRRSAAVAASLTKAGIGAGACVGVLARRDTDLVVALLGVLRSGAFYLPLDPGTPTKRMAAAVQDAGCQNIIVHGGCIDDEWPLPARLWDLSAMLKSEPVQRCLRSQRQINPEDPAYVLFTSGSTGRPKGVAVPHRAAVNLVRWAGNAFGAHALARTLAVTPITFDLSVFELFAPLAHGCCVYVLGDVLELADAPEFSADASLLNTVPSAVTTLLEKGQLPRGLKVINVAGEPFTADLIDDIHRHDASIRLVNLYGPSETTTYSTFADLSTRPDGVIPIGRPVSGTHVAVVDEDFRPVSSGRSGELLIGGTGVALGYVGKPAMTAERFLPDPHRPGKTLYRSGDIVRLGEDGQLQFLGRVDRQVKIRGFRVELGDVERALCATGVVREAVVLASGESQERKLSAYLVPRSMPDNSQDWLQEIRKKLLQEIPAYMIPGDYAVIKKLPRNRHGKVDSNSLAEVDTVSFAEGYSRAPKGDTETRIAACWAQALQNSNFGATDDFLDVGGHSLLLTSIAQFIDCEFGVRTTLSELRVNSTIAEQAHYVDSLLRSGDSIANRSEEISRLDRDRYRAGPTRH